MEGEIFGMPIETVRIPGDETIVLHVPYGECDLDFLKNVCDELHHAFPDRTILALPDKLSLSSCSKAVLQAFVNMVNEVIESKEKQGILE